MSIDSGWNIQAVTALDLSAMSASESIVNSSHDTERVRATVQEDSLGGKQAPVAEVTELTTRNTYESDGPAMPLRVTGGSTDYDSGLIRPVASGGEGSPVDMLREQVGMNQMDRAFSASLAALDYTDQMHIGRIVDYTA